MGVTLGPRVQAGATAEGRGRFPDEFYFPSCVFSLCADIPPAFVWIQEDAGCIGAVCSVSPMPGELCGTGGHSPRPPSLTAPSFLEQAPSEGSGGQSFLTVAWVPMETLPGRVTWGLATRGSLRDRGLGTGSIRSGCGPRECWHHCVTGSSCWRVPSGFGG